MKGVLFTYLLTYGGAAASLFNPYIGLLIYVCFAIVRPGSMWHWAVPEGNYSRVVAVSLLIGWVIQGCGRWQLGRAWALVVSALGFLLWASLSALQANDRSAAWMFVEELLKIVLPFLVGITCIDSTKRLKQLVWVMVLSQGYVAFELNVSYYQGFNRVLDSGFGGMDNNSVAIAMVTGTGFAFFLGLHEERWWRKTVCLMCALLMVHVVFFGMSRGGMVALIVTALVAFVLIPKQPRHYLVFALLVLVALRLAGPQVRDRFASSFADKEVRDFSAQSRLDLWRDMWDCALKRPVFGVGPNNFPLIIHEYGWPAGKHGHSLWIQSLAEVGFPGLALLLSFYGMCIYRLYRLSRHPESLADPWLCCFARMVIASLAGFAVAAQFVSLIGLEQPYYVVLVGAGTLKLATRRPADHLGAGEAGEQPVGSDRLPF
jgi:probable O-glycosylation ligase (exosortase A-associated)